MKILLVILLNFFLSIGMCYSQVNINNIQVAATLVSVDASTPNNPYSYNWSEVTNTKQGVHISVVPPEKAEIYLQLNNSWINYNTWNWGFMQRLEVSYDGGNWQTIFNNQNKDASGWIQSPFTTLGYHSISIKWIGFGIAYYRDYDIYVVPQSSKFYKDNYGNTITSWEGGNSDKIILISEGFDPYNTTYSEYLRYKGKNLFEPFIQAGYKIYFLNYNYNSQDMRNSSAIFNSASRYISSINSNTHMLAAGVSMGGVIVRYALAKAENDGNPLPFNKFISIDAPQQGAVFDEPFQDFLRENNNITDFQRHGLNNDAAKQLLKKNSFGDLYSSFYSELNNLNGGIGYPSLTENIGVSFSNNSPNPGNGRWVVITLEYIGFPGTYIYESSFLYDDIKVPGSYLPRTLVESDLTPFIFGMTEVDRDPNNNPTFIPYTSALDIINGNSKFVVPIQANANYFHDQFPPEVVTALLNKFFPLTATMTGPSYLSSGQVGTFIVSASGGTPPYSYAWSYYTYCSEPLIASVPESKAVIVPNSVPCGYWFNISNTTNTITRAGDGNGRSFQVKCIVTDASNNTVTLTHDVSCSISHPPLPKQQAVNNDAVLSEMKTELLDNYPNPFNPSTIISYSIKTEGRVSLKIYNTLGEEVRTLVDEIKQAGNYEAEFNASELPSGIYIYRM
jgi:hypothetical protein